MKKVYIALDNGSSGSWAMIGLDIPLFVKTPVKNCQSYTKTERHTDRLDWKKALRLLKAWVGYAKASDADLQIVLMERPMVNPGRFFSTVNAIRCLEATSVVLELLGLEYRFIDSKQWQHCLLEGLHGEDLKKESAVLATKLFPECTKYIEKHKDGDSLLMAEWNRRVDDGEFVPVPKKKRSKKV